MHTFYAGSYSNCFEYKIKNDRSSLKRTKAKCKDLRGGLVENKWDDLSAFI